MTTKGVAIVILNWNGKQWLEKFLPSVIEHSKSHRIIVADNGSTDDSLICVEQNFPTVEIIRLGKNYGFAEGYNLALNQISASYYILLNSDVEVTTGWADKLVDRLEKDPTIAACQPVLKDFNKKNFFEYAGASGGFIDALGYPYCRGRIFNSIEEDQDQYRDSVEIFWATGACIGIRSNLFHEVGGFDAYYFAHMEEIDLCWRLKNRGYKIWVETSCQVYHVGGGTLNKVSPKKTYLNFRNNLITLVKNDRSGILLLKVVLRLILDGIAGIKFLAEGNPSHTIAVIKAHFHFYGRLANILSLRKILKQFDNSPNQIGIHCSSILAEYYLKGKKKFSEI